MKQPDLKARYPRSLIEKIGVKPEHKVTVDRVEDEGFWSQLEATGADIAKGKLRKGSDVIIYGAEKIGDLGKLEKLRAHIKDNGMIWVVWPKGRKDLREDDVRNVALEIGLVDVKVIAFSKTLSGLKLVIPVALRSKK